LPIRVLAALHNRHDEFALESTVDTMSEPVAK
jgi:hypothetical protein